MRPSVFWACGWTMILPWNTPVASPSIAVLNSSRLSPWGAAWSMSSVESACWRPFSIATPLI